MLGRWRASPSTTHRPLSRPSGRCAPGGQKARQPQRSALRTASSTSNPAPAIGSLGAGPPRTGSAIATTTGRSADHRAHCKGALQQGSRLTTKCPAGRSPAWTSTHLGWAPGSAWKPSPPACQSAPSTTAPTAIAASGLAERPPAAGAVHQRLPTLTRCSRGSISPRSATPASAHEPCMKAYGYWSSPAPIRAQTFQSS